MVSKREERWKIFNARFETFFLSCWLSLNLKRGGGRRKKRLEQRSIKKRSRAGGGGVVIAARKLI